MVGRVKVRSCIQMSLMYRSNSYIVHHCWFEQGLWHLHFLFFITIPSPTSSTPPPSLHLCSFKLYFLRRLRSFIVIPNDLFWTTSVCHIHNDFMPFFSKSPCNRFVISSSSRDYYQFEITGKCNIIADKMTYNFIKKHIQF